MAAREPLSRPVRVIPISRWKMAGAVLPAALLAWWAASTGDVLGWVLFWTLSPALALTLPALIKRPSLCLDKNGLTSRPLFYKPARLLWIDVEGEFGLMRSRGFETVTYNYKPDRRPSFWNSVTILPYLEISPRELAALLNAYRLDALAAVEADKD